MANKYPNVYTITFDTKRRCKTRMRGASKEDAVDAVRNNLRFNEDNFTLTYESFDYEIIDIQLEGGDTHGE